MPKRPPPPIMSFRLNGWAGPQCSRVRQGVFGLVLEELFVHQDGRSEWRRARLGSMVRFGDLPPSTWA